VKTDIARLVRATDDGPEVQVVIDWLVQIGERHHLGIAPPSQAQAAAILPLLDVLSREFRDYRDVVARSRNAARRNAEQLAEVVRSSSEQGVLVRATAQAAAGAGSGASLMTGVADALGRFAQAAAGAATDAGDSLGAIDAALGQLKGRLSEGDAPLIVMRTSTAGVAAFLSTLGRLSRHAQLLGVNASIEAAHLAEAGSRFGIVAQEVRKLSASTRESKADVALIVGELREATEQVAVAVQDSKETTTAAGREIGGAGEALGQTARGIAELQQMVADVADVAMNQQGALEAICSSVDQISHHAEGLASAAQTAAQLDLGSLLDHAHARVSRWSLYERKAGPSATSDAFGRWIATLVGGMDPKAPADVDADADMRPLVAAVRTLLERISGEQRDILGDVIEVAVAVARNSFAWRSIAEALGGVSSQIALVRAAVGESAGAARTSAELAGGMGSLVEAMRLQYDTALQLLEGALTRISRIAGSVAQIDGFVESMDAAALRADRIMALIETLSAETDLLSLNAAIEAAHAGELGRGFSRQHDGRRRQRRNRAQRHRQPARLL